MVTAHTAAKQLDGNYFITNLSVEHANELDIPNMIEFQKNTKSFVESVSIIADKIKRIKEILDE